MKYPWLFVGAKVVCVDASNNQGHSWKGDIPIEGCIYTVRGISNGEVCVREKGLVILLEEIKNSTVSGGYGAHRFGPVLPDTTKQVKALRQMMLDHVTNASGGMGIKKPVRA